MIFKPGTMVHVKAGALGVYHKHGKELEVLVKIAKEPFDGLVAVVDPGHDMRHPGMYTKIVRLDDGEVFIMSNDQASKLVSEAPVTCGYTIRPGDWCPLPHGHEGDHIGRRSSPSDDQAR